MCQNRVDGDEEFVGHIAVTHAAGDAGHDFPLTFGEHVLRFLLRSRVTFGAFFKQFDSGKEEVVFHATMLQEILLPIEEIEKNHVEQFVGPISFVIFNDEVFEFL